MSILGFSVFDLDIENSSERVMALSLFSEELVDVTYGGLQFTIRKILREIFRLEKHLNKVIDSVHRLHSVRNASTSVIIVGCSLSMSWTRPSLYRSLSRKVIQKSAILCPVLRIVIVRMYHLRAE